jgi:Rab-GTPase-TBC domain
LSLKTSNKEYEKILHLLNKRANMYIPISTGRVERCNCLIGIGNTCSKGLAWLRYKFKDFYFLEASIFEYERILSKVDKEGKDAKQIEHDLPRTFSEIEFFKKEGPGYQKLRNVLYAVSVYFKDVGYVQGMNFIAACFLLHVDEVWAFWLFVYLVESLNM